MSEASVTRWKSTTQWQNDSRGKKQFIQVIFLQLSFILLKVLDQSLPGYEESKTIKIKYDIPEGIQSQNHPNPGAKYVHTIRIAYLPHTPEGCEIFHVSYTRNALQ